MKDWALRILRACIGLAAFAFGVYLTVQANIGLAPWDTFSMGLSLKLGLPFGTASMLVSAIILLIDIMMREHIGIGTVLDAFLVGACLNVYDALNLVPEQTGVIAGIALMAAGLFLMAFCQYLYMSAGLCCGPRDTLLVGLGRRVRKLPIGFVNILLLACVLIVGYLLGGPVGIGTIISVVGTGAIMQLVFRIVRFEPRDVNNIGFSEMIAQHHNKA